MSDTKASAETAASALGGGDGWAGVQSGGDVFITVTQVMAAVLSLLGDTDSTMAANSDSKFATQKAVKAAIAAAVTSEVVYKGVIDCSASPNYPAASTGWLYVISVAGLIGGGSGVAVSVGDLLLCKTTGSSGNQATVGANWDVVHSTYTAFTGGTMASAINEAPAVTVASSSTPAIFAAAGNTINMTGTTTVTGFDTIAAGAVRRVIFAGVLQLTYNATSMQNLTAANITTAAGDVAEFESLGSGNTKMLSYTRANGQALVGSATSFTYAAQAWVAASGNDSTGTIGNRNLPFATINAALDALPSTGGDIYIGVGTFAPIASDVVAGGSTLNGSSKLKSYVRFFGSGMPALDSETAPTTLVSTSGTVIQGPIYIHSTRAGVEFHSLGIDSGSAVCTALYSGATNIDALVWANVGQVNALAPALDPVVESVRCLAASATVQVHALCMENCLRPYANNLDLVFGTHGLAYKCVDGRISNIVSRGHSSDCFVFKESNTNNNTAPCHDNVASNLVCDQIGASDTPVGISLQTASTRPMERLSITNVTCRNMTTDEVVALTTCTSGTPGLVQHVTITSLQTDNVTVRTSLASYDSATVLINAGASLGFTLDTDGTLAANSDTRVASQKATKTAIATAIAGVTAGATPDGGGGVPTVFYQGDNSGDYTSTSTTPVAIKAAFQASIQAKVGDIIEVIVSGLMYVASGAMQVNFKWGPNSESSTFYSYIGQTVANQASVRRIHTVVSGDLSSGVLVVVPQWFNPATGGTMHLANNQDDALLTVRNYGDGSGFGGRLGSGLATKTGAYTMTTVDCTILANTASSSFTVTLPAAPIQGQMFNVKKISASNTLTIARNGNNIDGAASDLTVTANNQNTRLQFDTTFGWATL